MKKKLPIYKDRDEIFRYDEDTGKIQKEKKGLSLDQDSH